MSKQTLKSLRKSASLLFQKSKYRQASNLYAKLLENYPAEICASDFREYAFCLIELKKLEKALGILRQWEAAEADSAVLFSMKGYVCKMLHYIDLAEEALTRSVEIKPRASGYCLLGDLLAENGNVKSAVVSFKKAIGCDPNYDEAYYNLGVLLQKHSPEQAKKYFLKATILKEKKERKGADLNRKGGGAEGSQMKSTTAPDPG